MEIKSLEFGRLSKSKKTKNKNHSAAVSKRLDLLKQNLKNLERFEKGIKKHMQDRINFKSVQTAYRADAMLIQLARKQDILRSEIKELRDV